MNTQVEKVRAWLGDSSSSTREELLINRQQAAAAYHTASRAYDAAYDTAFSEDEGAAATADTGLWVSEYDRLTEGG